MPAITYPPVLESHWLGLAREATHTVSDRDALRRLLPIVRRLTDRFTTGRPETSAPPYLKDLRACIAYSLYFGPQTHARQTLLLDELPPLPTDRPLRVLDLGAGTGAAGWALLDHLNAQPVRLTAWDHSRTALRCLHELFDRLHAERWPQVKLRTHIAPLADLVNHRDTYDVILLHYVLNELTPPARQTLLALAAKALTPGGRLIICEPLVHDAGDYLRELRAQALGDLGLHLLAPCPHEHACPLPEPCHDVRSWQISRALQILNTHLRRNVHHLDFASLVLTPAPPPRPENFRARVVSSPALAKGQTICRACCSDGHIHHLQLLHRDADKDGRKRLRRLERGDMLELAAITPLADSSLSRATPLRLPAAQTDS
ncbi:MAG: methyltransferase [Lentisphaerae bacterium]|jgi:ribosomal protein RSM22 (predicted rRNA methylase)|nr:methyltransferase [Lentisphaerota bacterium]